MDTKKIHVAILGFEYDRVLKPIIKFGADKVLLLTAEEKDKNTRKAEDYQKYIVEDLKNLMSKDDIKTDKVSFYNYEECVSKLFTVLNNEIRYHGSVEGESNRKKISLFVNVSSGTRIVTTAIFTVCSVLRPNLMNMKIFYAQPTHWGGAKAYKKKSKKELIDEALTTGLDIIREIPPLPLPSLSSLDMKLLRKIKDKGEKVEKMIDLGSGKEETRKSEAVQLSKRVKHLEEQGYLETEKIGKETSVKLTPLGKMYSEKL